MPSLYYRVEAAGINILKSVTDEVVFGLLEELDLTRSFENGVYINSSFMAASDYSNGQGSTTMVRNRCDVETHYVMDKAQVPWPTETRYTTTALGRRSSDRGNFAPIMVDTKAGIVVEQETVACAVELNFALTFVSFDEATKAFDTIQSRYKGNLIQTPFHLAYSYPVTFEMLKFLTAVFQAKTDYQNKELIDYINDIKQTQISFDVRKSQLDKEDADMELMIRCQQLNCLMQLTMDQKEPEVVRQEGLPESFTIGFTSVIQFGRPSVVAIHTPVSVDNTVLPNSLFSSVTLNTHYDPTVAGIYSSKTCNEFMRRSYGNFNNANMLVRMPVYDDWLQLDNQYRFFQYRPFFVAHFTLDGPTTTIDLSDLGEIRLHAVVQELIKETGETLFDYGGLFNLGVYAGDLKLSKELLSIDGLKLTIASNRPDKVYHLVISETTDLTKTDIRWNDLLIKYRYFFPMTIERNLKHLIDKQYFYIAYEDRFLSLIIRLSQEAKIKTIFKEMVSAGEVNNDIYHYTQNASQLADFLVYTKSLVEEYKLPIGTSPADQIIRDYYSGHASVAGRSLFVVFLERCLYHGYITLDNIPMQYLDVNRSVYPYYAGQGGYYGFNTPLRIFNYSIRT